VREALCELELPHVQRTCARGSPKRQQLFEERGRFQVPYLEDPNEGVAMFESAAIVDYLARTYGPRSS
jgi:glutathione S-transferase